MSKPQPSPHSDYPDYYVDWDNGFGVMRENFYYATGIRTNPVSTDQLRLNQYGLLTVYKGYVWDFGSGPAIDTPSVVYASLCHDALYDLMNRGLLDRKYRIYADKLFRKHLRQTGTNVFRRWYMYLGVRIGWPVWRLFK